MGASHSRTCDAPHSPRNVYVVTIRARVDYEDDGDGKAVKRVDKAARRDAAMRYLQTRFAKDVEFRFAGMYAFSDRATVSAELGNSKARVAPVVLRVRWKEKKGAAPVFAEDVARQMCIELDGCNRSGSWPVLNGVSLVRLDGEKRWRVDVPGVLSYRYDGVTEPRPSEFKMLY